MSNFSDFISSGGSGSLPVNIVLTESQTWVPPVDGNICIHVIGGGGAGQSGTSLFRGGGAGGYCKKNSLAVTTAGSFTVVVGAGRGGKEGDWSDAAAGAGGASTVAGTGLGATLTANGGTGASGSNYGAGGTASGGDVNNTGGVAHFAGGGAVGIYGTGQSGDNNDTYRAGSCDAQGPESLIGYGQIFGGRGGLRCNPGSSGANDTLGSHSLDGEFLAGGATLYASTNQDSPTGGSGGIGGGGGGCRNQVNGRYRSGSGGDGIVIIQYLPA